MRTLIIANTVAIALTIYRAHRLRDARAGVIDRYYETVPAKGAVRALDGAHFDRIVIASDWMRPGEPLLRWSLPLGGWSPLWYKILTAKVRGAEVVWE